MKILYLLGGLGVFIYGMKVMSEGIQKVAGRNLRKLLSYVTNNRVAGVFVGFSITSLIQSSSATTVMVVSFVNAGLLTVLQSIGVIMGANIGTTVTAWILSFFGESAKISVGDMALPIIAVSVPMLFSGIKRWKNLGEFAFGFGLLFVGLGLMKDVFSDLKHNPEVLEFLSDFTNFGFGTTLLFVLIGTVLTIMVQSSSAAMAITLLISANGWIPIHAAAAIILGENIGTTITAYLASLVGNVNAKRAARAHLIFNIFGVIWMLFILQNYLRFVDWMNINWVGAEFSMFSENITERGRAMGSMGMALFHTSFNVINTLLLIGFVNQINKIVVWMVKDKRVEFLESRISNKNLINTPELAIVEAKNDLKNMLTISSDMFDSFKSLYNGTTKNRTKEYESIQKGEDRVDEIELEATNFLIEMSQTNSSETTGNQVIDMIKIANELERIADVNYQLSKHLEKKEEYAIVFKNKAEKAINEMIDLVDEFYDVTSNNLKVDFEQANLIDANDVNQKIYELRAEVKNQYFRRLQKKEENPQEGFIFRDILYSLEKLSDHLYTVNEAIVGVV